MFAYKQQSAETETGVMTGPAPSLATTRYRREDSMNLTPVQVIQRLYDVAIMAIRKDDRDLARRAINELISALNFEHREVALGLFKLYDYSKTMLRQGKNDEALTVLLELRSAWVEAFKL